MLKECIVIIEKGKPTQVCEIKHFDPQSFLLFKRECETNKADLVEIEKEKEKELYETIETLKHEIECLKAEIKFDRGEITQEEYDNVMGSNS